MEQEDNIPPGNGTMRQADERLIHALLLHLHDDGAAEHRERRVQRAMRAIRGPAAPQSSAGPALARFRLGRPLGFPGWARRIAWAAAAMILVTVGLWLFTNSSTPAKAALNDIIGALGRPGDRTYRIHMEDLPEPPGRRPPDDEPPQNVPKPSLHGATLYLRDGHQYLLVRDDPNGGILFDGYDGRQSWRIKDGVLAETKEGLGAGGIPMPPMMADVPFSDLHQTLERIRVDYTVEQFDQASLPSGNQVLQHVCVRRNSHDVKGPETIEIWADPKTAMPKRIIFDRAKLQGNPQACRLTFDLVSEDTLSPDWFSPTAHTAGRADHTEDAPAAP